MEVSDHFQNRVTLSAEGGSDIHVSVGWVVRGNDVDAMVERKISPVLEKVTVLHTIAKSVFL